MAATSKPHLVLYDGECSLCTFQMKVLTWLDWFGSLRLLPNSDPRARQAAPGLSAESLSAAIHCVTADGRVHRGVRCIRFVSLRLPLLIPLGLILWFPGVLWVAEKVYARVSRNRLLLSKVFGCKTACRVMPTRRREHEIFP